MARNRHKKKNKISTPGVETPKRKRLIIDFFFGNSQAMLAWLDTLPPMTKIYVTDRGQLKWKPIQLRKKR